MLNCIAKYSGLFLVGIVLIMIVAACSEPVEPLPVLFTVDSVELEDVYSGEYTTDNGKVKLVAFYLIHCADGTCGTTMADFHHLQQAMKDEGWFGIEAELVAMTIDPTRDTRDAIREYSDYFHPDPSGWRFVRADSDQATQEMVDSYKFFYALDETETAHSTFMFLVDKDHQVRALHTMSRSDRDMDHQDILENMAQLIEESHTGHAGGH